MGFRAGLLILLLATASCGPARLVYSGRDVEDASTGLIVKRAKDPEWIALANAKYGFLVFLPYATDWTFESSLKDPLFASSSSLEFVASLKFYAEKGLARVEEERYLRGILENQTRVVDKIGGRLAGASTPRQGDHFALEYRVEIDAEGRTFRQQHFWGLRQNDEGLIYDLHLSTTCSDESRLAVLAEKARDIIARRFRIVP